MKLFFQDYLVIGLYFAFIIGIGFIYRRVNKDTSDYFRGGGSMSWWMTGASVFMANFSAWTFVACGGRIYKYGTMIAIGFLLTGFWGLIMAFTVVKWFRRMRAITPVDTLFRRYGRVAEQFYAWITFVISFLFSGIALYVLSVFISPLLGIPINACIALLGGTIVFMSVSGGAWAVVASDFVQMLVLVIIVCVVAYLVLDMPEVGGITGLISKAPKYQFDWTVFSRLPVMITFVATGVIMSMMTLFDMNTGAARFLYVRSDKDAKKACIMFAIGFLVGPAIWFIPPVAASFVIPNLAEQFSHLKNPEEAAYLAMAAKVLPKGMLGMLACGIFAATMSAMDTGLNRTSGIIVRNIYKPLIKPHASEKELLLIGKLVTLAIGVIMIFGGMFYSKLANFSLFQWTQHFNSLIMFPIAIPLSFGLIFRRTPKWTPIIAIVLLTSLSSCFKFGADFSAIAVNLGWGSLTNLELVDFSTSIIAISNLIGGIVIYTIASLCYKYFPLKQDDQVRVNSFFEDLKRPVTADSVEHKHTDKMQYRMLGTLCLIYGIILALGALMPNSLQGRVCFLICGGVIFGIGAILYANYKKLTKHILPQEQNEAAPEANLSGDLEECS